MFSLHLLLSLYVTWTKRNSKKKKKRSIFTTGNKLTFGCVVINSKWNKSLSMSPKMYQNVTKASSVIFFFSLSLPLCSSSALSSWRCWTCTGLLHQHSPCGVAGQQRGWSLHCPSLGSGRTWVWLRDRVTVLRPRRTHVWLHLQHQCDCC